MSLKRLWGITRNRGEVGGDVLPGITLVALSKKLSILILNCAFGVVTCCGYVTPKFSPTLPESDSGALCCGTSALSMSFTMISTVSPCHAL